MDGAGFDGGGYVTAYLLNQIHSLCNSTISASDFRDLPALAARFKTRTRKDGVEAYLWDRLSTGTQKALANYDPASGLAPRLQRALAKELTELTRGDCFYDKRRFAGVRLRPATRRLLRQAGEATAAVEANRRLLQDAFPEEIKPDAERKRFLDQVDLLAGTSSGGWTALYLAKHKRPEDALPGLLPFWKRVIDAMSPDNSGLGRLARAAAGFCAVGSSDRLRALFRKEFGDLRLGELQHSVLITSFQLDNRRPRRSWQPKVFHNFGEDKGPKREPDRNEFVVDVAMRTGSAPLLFPIFQSIKGKGAGYLDGGIYANNPSLCAVAQILDSWEENPGLDVTPDYSDETPLNPNPKDPERVRLQHRISEIAVLSVGNGATEAYVDAKMQDGVADWGYQKWMMDPQHFARLLHVMMECGTSAVDYQCREILRGNYFRLQPWFPERLTAYNGEEVDEAIEQMKNLDYTQHELADSVGWLEAAGWFGAEA